MKPATERTKFKIQDTAAANNLLDELEYRFGSHLNLHGKTMNDEGDHYTHEVEDILQKIFSFYSAY